MSTIVDGKLEIYDNLQKRLAMLKEALKAK